MPNPNSCSCSVRSVGLTRRMCNWCSQFWANMAKNSHFLYPPLTPGVWKILIGKFYPLIASHNLLLRNKVRWYRWDPSKTPKINLSWLGRQIMHNQRGIRKEKRIRTLISVLRIRKIPSEGSSSSKKDKNNKFDEAKFS